MKLIVMWLVIGVHISAFASAQNITLKKSNVHLTTILKEIKKQTGYSFLYDANAINEIPKMNINVEQSTVRETLDVALRGTSLQYLIRDNSIFISKKKQDIMENLSLRSHVQRVVSGYVRNDKGVALNGVNIKSNNDRAQTQTDHNGFFSLNVDDNTKELIFTYIGYKSQRYNLSGDQKLLSITLESDVTSLDELVVVGFGSQKKSNLTGAVSTITAKELGKRPVISAANALQGLDPAVNLTLGTGSPESAYSIDIRGSISINSGTPLILVDGIESNLRYVNPNDIESISILKDASASSIYGAKASAGVILITTKAGKNIDGKAIVDYSGRFGIAQNTTSTDFIKVGYDHVTLTNKFYNAYNGVDIYQYPAANGELQKLLDRRNDKVENPERPWVEVGDDGRYYYYGNHDWFGYLYNRERSQYEHNLSANGGSDKINYFISGRYIHNNGVFKIFGDTFHDYSLRAKMSAALNSKLRYSSNVNMDRSEMRYPGRPEYEQTIWALQAQTTPAFIPFNPDGSIVQYPNQLYSGSPMGTGYLGAITANNTWNSKVVRNIVLSNQLEYNILDNWKVTGLLGYKMRDPINKYRNNIFEYSRALGVFDTFTSGAVENAYTENRYSETQTNVDLFTNYSHQWEGGHNFKLTAGVQYINYYYSTLQAKQTDLANRDLATFSVANGVITLNQTINSLKSLGVFGRMNYDYKQKYLVEISGRADGSSRFEKGSRWGYFPSVSLGWRVSDEKFFRPIQPVVNNLKIRYSNGSLGNHQVSGYYPYIDQINIDNVMNYTFDDAINANYANVSAPISSSLTWETVSTSNLGIDLNFLNNRLSVTSDFYVRNTKDMLVASMTLPDVYGANTPKANNANLQTKGFEVYFRWNDKFDLGGKKFTYGITTTLGDYLTKITKFHNPDKIISDFYEGKTLGEIWGYRVEGLFQSDEEAADYQARINDVAVNQRIYNSKGVGENKLRAGDVKFKDIDGDNIISSGNRTVESSGDLEIIGNSLPRYSYSFRMDGQWNNFDLSAFFQGIVKRNWYPASGQSSYDFWGPYAFSATSFIHKDFEKMTWTDENMDAYFPRQRGYQAYSGGALGEVNDRYIQNVGYLRLKNLTVGYTIPVNKKWINRMRVFASGENLWYWSPLKKNNQTVDPELALTSSTYNTNSGVGYFYSKTYSINLDITF